MFLAFAVAALLGSQSLVNLAERQGIGTGRDVALASAKGVDRVANALSVNRPFDAAERALHGPDDEIDIGELLADGPSSGTADGSTERETRVDVLGTQQNPSEPGGDAIVDPAGAPTPSPDTGATDTNEPNGRQAVPRDPNAEGGAPGSPSATVPAPPAPQPPVVPPEPSAPPRVPSSSDAPRQVSAENPLRLWIGGDSLSRDLGDGLSRVTPVDVVEPTLDPQFSSGLSRPDFVDWPQRLAQLVSDPPDAVIIMFGANDYQDVKPDSTVLERGSEEWVALYRQRVGEAMDILGVVPDMPVTWVGLPAMKPGSYPEGGMEALNAIYAEESAKRSWVSFVPTFQLFADADGRYVESIDGQDLRVGDGIHLSRSGADRMASAVWAVAGPVWGLV